MVCPLLLLLLLTSLLVAFFFVPSPPLPLTHQEYIVRKAEKWRGERGERRKVAVYDHVWTPDETDAAAEVVRSKQSMGDVGNGSQRRSKRKGSHRGKAQFNGSGGRRMSADDAMAALRRNTGDEVTTHVAIHTVSLDGSTEVYRQFLRLPDGAVVEVFGTISGSLDRRVQKSEPSNIFFLCVCVFVRACVFCSLLFSL